MAPDSLMLPQMPRGSASQPHAVAGTQNVPVGFTGGGDIHSAMHGLALGSAGSIGHGGDLRRMPGSLQQGMWGGEGAYLGNFLRSQGAVSGYSHGASVNMVGPGGLNPYTFAQSASMGDRGGLQNYSQWDADEARDAGRRGNRAEARAGVAENKWGKKAGGQRARVKGERRGGAAARADRASGPAVNGGGGSAVSARDGSSAINSAFEGMFVFNSEEARSGSNKEGSRTTIMVRNIPNKYNQKMLLEMLDKHSYAQYDFFYLPIDFKNRCNLGYAFINFTNSWAAADFYDTFHDRKWPDFNSRKVCAVTYARVQGRESLIQHFKNSRFPCDDVSCLPLLFDFCDAVTGEPQHLPVPSAGEKPGGLSPGLHIKVTPIRSEVKEEGWRPRAPPTKK